MFNHRRTRDELGAPVLYNPDKQKTADLVAEQLGDEGDSGRRKKRRQALDSDEQQEETVELATQINDFDKKLLQTHTVAQLKAIAGKEGVSLKYCKRKEDIIYRIIDKRQSHN